MPSTSPKSSSNLIHEDIPRWNTASKIARVPWILIGAWFLVRGALWLVSGHVTSGILCMVLAAAYWVYLYFFIAPRRYQILDDRLRIVYGRPFAINVPLSRVEGIREHSLWGLEYVVSFLNCTSKESIEILLHKGSTFISPADRDIFMQKLNGALEKAKTDTNV
jgi:hypothetical protein